MAITFNVLFMLGNLIAVGLVLKSLMLAPMKESLKGQKSSKNLLKLYLNHTRAWKCIEMNNMILVHFDADNKDPSYLPIELPDINSGDFSYHGRSDHVIRCHVQVN